MSSMITDRWLLPESHKLSLTMFVLESYSKVSFFWQKSQNRTALRLSGLPLSGRGGPNTVCSPNITRVLLSVRIKYLTEELPQWLTSTQASGAQLLGNTQARDSFVATGQRRRQPQKKRKVSFCWCCIISAWLTTSDIKSGDPCGRRIRYSGAIYHRSFSTQMLT